MSASDSRVTFSTLPTFSSVSNSRLKSLYSDFSRQKASNPSSFTSNVDWWKRTLCAFVGHGMQMNSNDTLLLHASPDLAESLRHEGAGKPLGLAAVITELRDTHALIPLDFFQTSPKSIYDSGSLAYRIASYVVGKPFWWALEQLNIVDSEGVAESESNQWKKVKGPYIVLSNIERAGDAVVNRQQMKASMSPADSLYDVESFRREFGGKGTMPEGVSLSDSDLKSLIKFLERDRKVIVTDRETIKFIGESTEPSSRVITSVDRGVLELKSAVENMESQVEEIQRRVNEKTQKISENLKANRKEVAMTHLKARKSLEDLLKKRLTSLEILHSTLIQVEAAIQDLELMKQYESSTATLRTILSHPSLQREKIDETMDAMAEATADQREIDETIRLGMGAAQDTAVDENELESELAILIAEVRDEQRETEEIRGIQEKQRERGALPSVPSRPLPESGTSGLVVPLSPSAVDAVRVRDLPSIPRKTTQEAAS